jgi:activator of HSP90 ATPase
MSSLWIQNLPHMDKLTLHASFPVSADRLFNDWLSSEGHSAMTRSRAHIHPKADSPYSAGDGYISGITIELEQGRRILQSWRTSDFNTTDTDAMLELILDSTDTGCTLHLRQWNLPDGSANDYERGWQQFYFAPMLQYYEEGKK